MKNFKTNYLFFVLLVLIFSLSNTQTITYFECSNTTDILNHSGTIDDPYSSFNISLMDPNIKINMVILNSFCEFPLNNDDFSSNIEISSILFQKTRLLFPEYFSLILIDNSSISFKNLTLYFQGITNYSFVLNDNSSLYFLDCEIMMDLLQYFIYSFNGNNIHFNDSFLISVDPSSANQICNFLNISNINQVIFKNLTLENYNLTCYFIYLQNYGSFLYIDSKFHNNVVGSYYLQIHNSNNLLNYSVFLMKNISFYNNTQQYTNALIKIYVSSETYITLKRLSFLKNRDIDTIFDILSSQEVVNLILINSSFIKNNGIKTFFYMNYLNQISLNNLIFDSNSGSDYVESSGNSFLLYGILYLYLYNISYLNNTSNSQIIGIILIDDFRNSNILSAHHITFVDNIAFFQKDSLDNGNSDSYEGVFLYISLCGNAMINDSLFIRNQAISAGKTIINYYIDNQNNDSYIIALNLTNCIFIYNKADSFSNAIFFTGDQINILNTSFENQEGGDFGAIYLTSSSATFINLVIKNCIGILGSVFYISLNLKESDYYFENIILMNNIGSKSSIFLSTIYPFNMTFVNSSFSNNSVSQQGGVFFVKYSDGDSSSYIFSLFGCFFENNFAVISGGVGEMWQLGGAVNIFDSIFINNTSSEGGVFNLNQEITTIDSINNCVFIDNFADLQAAIFNILCATFYDDSSTYFYNSGAIAVIYFVSSYCDVHLSNSQIFNSYITALGNIVLVAKATISIQNITISDSNASVCAGLSFSGLVTLTVDGLFFYNNIAYRGTLFYSSSLLTSAYIKNVVSVNNSAQISLASFSFTQVTLEDISIYNSSSIIFVIQYATLNFSNLYVQNHICYVNQIGCVINIISKSMINITNLSCFDVFSYESEGIIYSSSSTINMSDSYFYNISVAAVADVLYAELSYIYLTSVEIQYYKNSAIGIYQSYDFIYEDGKCSNLNVLSHACINITTTNSILISGSTFYNISFSAISINNDLDFLQSTNFEMPNIQNCNFHDNYNQNSHLNNFESKGGCLYIENSYINISNSTFSNNQADIGGAIYLSSKDTMNIYYLYWLIQNNSFLNNTALISGGGAIFWDYNLPFIVNNVFLGNQGNFGNDLATFPFRMNISMNESIYKIFENILQNFSSGSLIPEGYLNFALLDYYNQITTSNYANNQDSNAMINFKDIYNFSYNPYKQSNNIDMRVILGSSINEFDNGFFNFSDLKLIALPNNTHTLTIYTNLIKNFNLTLLKNPTVHDLISENSYYYVLNITIAECQIGEIFNSDTNICESCSYGDYSLDVQDETCDSCPTNAICEGGNNIILNAGYWRESINSSIIYKCKNQKACLGGFESLCQSGFEGILCNTCIFNTTDRFFKNFDNLCYECSNAYYSYFIILAIFFLLIAYQTVTIRIKIRSRNLSQSCIMKILLNYLQLVNVINSFDIEIPDNIQSIFKFQSCANNPKQALFPLNCVYGIFNTSQNLFVLNSVFVCSFSVFYPMLVCLFLTIRRYIKKNQDKKRFRYIMTVSVLIVCYTLQPFFLNFFLSAFNCDQINDKSYLDDFLTQECWTTYHLTILYYLIIPFLMLWLVFLPLWAFFSMKKNTNHGNNMAIIDNMDQSISVSNINSSIDKKDMSLSYISPGSASSINTENNPYSFITDGYANHTYYWEFVIMIQKVLVIISITFIHNTNGLLCLFLFLFFFFIIIQIIMKPFRTYTLNGLQLYGYLTNFLIVFFCLCYKFRMYEWETLFYLILIIITNMFFMIFWMVLYIYSNKAIFLKIKTALSKKCPVLLRVFRTIFRNLVEKNRSPNIRPKEWKKRVISVA